MSSSSKRVFLLVYTYSNTSLDQTQRLKDFSRLLPYSSIRMRTQHQYLYSYHEPVDYIPSFDREPSEPTMPAAHRVFIADKFELPDTSNLLRRNRIDDLLSRSVRNYAVTLISGRAGTGKTAAAALFAQTSPSFSWYTADALDRDPGIFFSNLAASIDGIETLSGRLTKFVSSSFEGIRDIESDIIEIFGSNPCPELIVVEDIHHLFDTEWFDRLFPILIQSVPRDSHLLMTCRSTPPSPLWRMRSKQVLNLIEEELLYFSFDEASAFYRALGLDRRRAYEHQSVTLGHPRRMIGLTD